MARGPAGGSSKFLLLQGKLIGPRWPRQQLFAAKIQLKTDFGGLPIAFHLTGGEGSDSRKFETLLDIGPNINPPAALGDKDYDSKSNRDAARQRRICPAIPYRSTPKPYRPSFRKFSTKSRARIEQAVGKLNRFKRVAARRQRGITVRSSRSLSALS